MVWGPYRDPLFDEIENLFDEIHRRLLGIGSPIALDTDNLLGMLHQRISNMGVEVHDNGDKYMILIELPGFDKKDIKVKAEPRAVYVEAHRSERDYEGVRIDERHIKRVIPLSEEIIPKEVKARFNNGLLEITAPKKNPPKEKGGWEVRIE